MRLMIACVLAVTSLIAANEIVVPLDTQACLLPTYLCPWSAASTEIPSTHLQELGQVLHFDLHNNGTTKVAASSREAERLARDEGTRHFDAERWQALGIAFVVRAHQQGERLHLRVDGTSRGANLASYSVQLSGNLAVDRKQIHRLADAMHEDLFGSPGIASTSLLYTIRHKQPLTGEWRSEVWSADYDGANARKLTSDGSYCVTPTFLPPEPGHASGGFFYVSYKLGQPKIYAASLHAPRSQRLTSLRGNQLMPVVSPQRDHVAFISDAGGNPDLFIQDFDATQGAVGKPRQIYAARAAAQASPTFSPDGKELAFVSNKDGSPRIYRMTIPAPTESARTVKPTLITRENRENTCPAWSPDGRYIAYSAMTRGTRQIWLYDTQSREERQLTQGPGHKENPSWAPNSSHLVFNSATKSECELYLVNLHQPKAVKITSGPGEKRFPAWEQR